MCLIYKKKKENNMNNSGRWVQCIGGCDVMGMLPGCPEGVFRSEGYLLICCVCLAMVSKRLSASCGSVSRRLV